MLVVSNREVSAVSTSVRIADTVSLTVGGATPVTGIDTTIGTVDTIGVVTEVDMTPVDSEGTKAGAVTDNFETSGAAALLAASVLIPDDTAEVVGSVVEVETTVGVGTGSAVVLGVSSLVVGTGSSLILVVGTGSSLESSPAPRASSQRVIFPRSCAFSRSWLDPFSRLPYAQLLFSELDCVQHEASPMRGG